VFDDGEPVADARASRSVLRFVSGRAGAVNLWPGRTAQMFTVDGRTGSPGVELSADALARGVLLGLGSKGPVLLVRSGDPTSSPARYGLIGPSPTLSAVRDAVDALGPTPYPVLIQGETGTGKELVARGLHSASRRSDAPFVAINVAALATGTAVSQLFGHARGAYTGANRADAGFFGQAAGGTLFLDELGAATLDVQAQLLRAGVQRGAAGRWRGAPGGRAGARGDGRRPGGVHPGRGLPAGAPAPSGARSGAAGPAL
jgi:two-component system nitrogen regulation response regulator GlnG